VTETYHVAKAAIAEYWSDRAPQTWYSEHQPLTIQWFNELEYKRYHLYYPYLPAVMEFDAHAGERVLEIGVGVGTDLVSYARHGAIVSGIDLTANAVATTRAHLRCRGLAYETLQVADAETLPFASESFDLVYSFGVLHHTPHTDLALREVHRVLKPHGKAIVMLYARGWKHYVKRVLIHGVIRRQLLVKSYQRLVNEQTEVHGHSPLTYVYTRREVEALFAPFGSVEIRRHRMGEFFDYAPYGTYRLPAAIGNLVRLSAIERWLGENYVIKARKTTAPTPRLRVRDVLLKP
jgi:ubiquinone/menaquinone biosynthesis C-methylase UbiE